MRSTIATQPSGLTRPAPINTLTSVQCEANKPAQAGLLTRSPEEFDADVPDPGTLAVFQRLSASPSLLKRVVQHPRARGKLAGEARGIKGWLHAKERAARSSPKTPRCAGCGPSSPTFEFKKHRQGQCKCKTWAISGVVFGVKDFDLLSLVDWIDFECQQAVRLQEATDQVRQAQHSATVQCEQMQQALQAATQMQGGGWSEQDGASGLMAAHWTLQQQELAFRADGIAA